MPERHPPYLSFDEDDDDEWLRMQMHTHERKLPEDSHRPFGHEIPHYRSDTGDVIYACPECESLRTQPRHIARRVGGAIGAAAGGTSAAAAALSGAELGAAAGTRGGPFGVLCQHRWRDHRGTCWCCCGLCDRCSARRNDRSQAAGQLASPRAAKGARAPPTLKAGQFLRRA